MAEQTRFRFSGDSSLDGARNLLDALDASETPPDTVTVELELHDGTATETSADEPAASPDEVRVRAGTNQHVTLYLLAEYLKETGSDSATREDLHQWADDPPLSASQIGNSLGHLARMKGLLEVTQHQADRGGRVNYYSLTPEAERLIEELGTPADL